MIAEVSPNATVTLDDSGNGQVSLGPPSGTKWALRLATLAVSTSTNQPQGFLYRGSASGPVELVDSTYTGAQASSSKVGGALYFPGQLLWAVWKGGDPGAFATLQVYGQQGGRTDPLPLSPPGEGFANPVVAGTALIVPAINSPGFVAGGNKGWSIAKDGTAQFNDLILDGFVEPLVRVLVPLAQTIALATRRVNNIADQFTVDYQGGLTWNGDTTLSRFGAGRLQLGADNALDFFVSVAGNAGNAIIRATVNGEANARFFQELGGKMHWGPGGASAQDTVLYRAGVGTLASDPIKFNNAGTAEGWTGMTLLNGFSNRGAGFAAASYRRVPSPANTVQLVGQVSAGGASGTVMATLPAGYRPTTEQPFWAFNNTANVALLGTVGTNGNVTLFGSSLAAGNVCQFSGLVSLDL